MRLVLASNASWVVPADIEDRRFFVLDVDNDRKGKEKDDYFAAIHQEWENGGREAFLHCLLTRDISGNHRARPLTRALADQKTYSLAGAKRLVYQGLLNGSLPAHEVDGQLIFVATRLLWEAEGRRCCTEKALAVELAAAGGRNDKVVTEDHGRRGGFWMPRSEARVRWAEANGDLDVRWPDEPDSWEAVEDEEPPI